MTVQLGHTVFAFTPIPGIGTRGFTNYSYSVNPADNTVTINIAIWVNCDPTRSIRECLQIILHELYHGFGYFSCMKVCVEVLGGTPQACHAICGALTGELFAYPFGWLAYLL